MVRLGAAIDGPSVLYRGIWPTYFAAPLGVAAVAASLMDLDAAQTAHALALAVTLASPGVGHHNAATTSRWLAVGHAAARGLTAAQAARAGFTADLGLLDGAFLPGYQVSAKADVLDAGGASPLALSQVSFKPWCAARQTMAATQALAEIVQEGVAADAISAITAFVPPPHLKMIDHGVAAGDRASYLTSLPYQMARAVEAPDTALDPSEPPTAPAAGIAALMAKVTVAADESLLAGYPKAWPARVSVTTPSGRVERTVAHVPGDPERPLDDAALRAKFQRLVVPALGEQGARELQARALAALEEPRTVGAMLAAIARACGNQS
jgi:2-methylcitrate dehydratase PrpD